MGPLALIPFIWRISLLSNYLNSPSFALCKHDLGQVYSRPNTKMLTCSFVAKFSSLPDLKRQVIQNQLLFGMLCDVFKRGMTSGILTHWARPLLSLKCGCGKVSGLWNASVNNTSFIKTMTPHMPTRSTEGLSLLIWAFMLYTDVWNCVFSHHHQGAPTFVNKLAQTFFHM